MLGATRWKVRKHLRGTDRLETSGIPACRAVLAAGSLLLCGVLFLASCGILSPQYRYLREVKNRTEVPAQYEALTFAQLLALPALPRVYEDGDWDAVRAHAARAVSLEGYVGEVRRVGDGWNYGPLPWQGDVHVHLRDQPQPRCFPDGPRGGQIVTEVTPHFQPPRTGWSDEALWDLCLRQVRVRISGWLMHDYQHLDGVGRWRASAWEIHPVTKIEVWDPERQAWQPLP